MVDEQYLHLLLKISETWPPSFHFNVDGQQITSKKTHPLFGEMTALLAGERASLPYFSGDKLAWVTVAPDVEGVIAAIGDLRAWVIPSFGWEDDTKPLVLTGETNAPISELLFKISPSGYFRWWSLRSDVTRVCEKLRQMRTLAGRRPEHTSQVTPSLFDLRQQFQVALVTRDREAAQSAIDSIDNHELDSAANTAFMQLRMWDHFREFEHIATYPKLVEIAQIRLPKLVRVAILRAFYNTFLSILEAAGDLDGALRSYGTDVHPVIAGLIRASSVNDGPEILRLIAYKARHENDPAAIEAIVENTDEIVTALLVDFKLTKIETPPLSDQYEMALRTGNWSKVQIVGRELLEMFGEVSNEGLLTRHNLVGALTVSLSFHANDELKVWLRDLLPTLGRPTDITSADLDFTPAQNWTEYVDQIRTGRTSQAEEFLSLDERPLFSSLTPIDAIQLVNDIEELLTDPVVNANQTSYLLTSSAVPLIINDLLADPTFPRSELVSVYKKLLEIWSESKRGSALTPDANLLLMLAEVTLQLDASSGSLVVVALREWWLARPHRTLLPFVLAAVDLITEYTSDVHSAETLWIGGADLIKNDPSILTWTERTLWRLTGSRIGLDEPTITEFVNLIPIEEEAFDDPLSEISLSKVAIITLREGSADQAASLIRERTQANVIVVTATSAGSSTDSAKTADVILFVWASSTHAVYRAFDAVRDKLVYVQGTGASSIVAALERWATSRQRRIRTGM